MAPIETDLTFVFERTLHLTSPHMKGPDVDRAQHQLHTNKWGEAWLEDMAETGFGPDTAAACKTARWELGFPRKECRPKFDQELSDALTGKQARTPRERARMKRRAEAAGSIGAKAIELGKKEVGTKENPPNSNRVKYSEWYGITGPWCAMFVTWCFVNAGSKTFTKGSRWAYCPYLLAAAKRGDQGMKLVSKDNAAKGDVVLFDWEHNGTPDHVGIFIEWIAKGKTARTLEGNTSPTNNSNGGEVMIRERDVSLIEAYIRIAD